MTSVFLRDEIELKQISIKCQLNKRKRAGRHMRGDRLRLLGVLTMARRTRTGVSAALSEGEPTAFWFFRVLMPLPAPRLKIQPSTGLRQPAPAPFLITQNHYRSSGFCGTMLRNRLAFCQ